MEIKKNYLPSGCECDTTKRFADGLPDSITVHWTGPLPGQSPADVRKWWIDSHGEASAHYIIKDNECLQCWPDYKVAWHAGNKKGNESSIGIEVIPCNKDGTFSPDSIKTLKELIAKLKADLNKDLKIVRHFDWSGKECPAWYVNEDRWHELLRQIS